MTEHFLMVGIVFFAMSHVYKEGKHIRVEFLTKYFPRSLLKPLWIGFDITGDRALASLHDVATMIWVIRHKEGDEKTCRQ